MSKKKQVGRPLESPQARDNIIGIRLNETELMCLSQYCWRYELSMSEVIRQALEVLSVIPVNPKSNK